MDASITIHIPTCGLQQQINIAGTNFSIDTDVIETALQNY